MLRASSRHDSIAGNRRGTPRRALIVRAEQAPPRRSAVISGASSGIGKASAALLAESGWRVFAGVRNDAAAEELRSMHSSIEPVFLEVTSPDSVRRAVATVGDAVGDAGLQGLVNNAGFGIFLPLECFPDEAWEAVMATNVTGALRCTREFLPLLRRGEKRGRVVNMSSIAGSVSFPLFGAYSASKHALEAMSDALRFELRDQNIPVSIIKPGPVVTNIWGTAREGSARREVGPEGRALYGRLIDKTLQLTEDSERNGVPASAVAAVVLESLASDRPKERYYVGSSYLLHTLRRLLPGGALTELLAAYYK